MGSARTMGAFLWNTLRGQHALLLTVVAAIGLSLFFVPRGAELGRLNLGLGFTHKAIAILEERNAAGDTSAATMGALAQTRAQVGDLAGAVSLLEQLLGNIPATLICCRRWLVIISGSAASKLPCARWNGSCRPADARLVPRTRASLRGVQPPHRATPRSSPTRRRASPGCGQFRRTRQGGKSHRKSCRRHRGVEAARKPSARRGRHERGGSRNVLANFGGPGRHCSRAGRAVACPPRAPARDALPLAGVFAPQGYPALALKLIVRSRTNPAIRP